VDDVSLVRAARRAVDLVGGRRRLLAAGFAGIAVLAGLHAVSPDPPPATRIWVAARDLSGGRPLVAADVSVAELPVAAVPAGALPAGQPVRGRFVAAPMRRGEPLTDVRLLEPALLEALSRPGLVAVPVRVADGSAATALVHAGDRVDVLAVSEDAAGRTTTAQVASNALVLSVPAHDDGSGSGAGLVVVAVSPTTAERLARSGATARLSVALEHP
jgi:pilus assembly protein CpaB